METPGRGHELRPAQVWLMAFAVGAVVANIYYIQPLLAVIATHFRITPAQVGRVAMITQLGTALGMFCFVPLGDTTERRGLIVRLLIAAAAFLCLVASATNIVWLAVASFGVGMTGATVHVIVPFAAHLAPSARRGAIVGTVLSGLLCGILLARTFSGFLNVWLGWRAIYWIAGALMLILGLAIRFGLPESRPELRMSWPKLIHSTAGLIRTQPILREASLLGATFFCAFSAFWTTLVFFLATPPYHYGSDAVGLFGLVGLAGALCAPIAGRSADRLGARRNVFIALLLALSSFVVFFCFGRSLFGLVLGVILLDVGVQSGHVSNQTRIYSLLPEARSRLNMVYMISYFVAGAIGSYAGSALWQAEGWPGVCGFGFCVLLGGCGVYFFTRPAAMRSTT